MNGIQACYNTPPLAPRRWHGYTPAVLGLLTHHRGLLREDSGGKDAQREGDASGEGVGVHREWSAAVELIRGR